MAYFVDRVVSCHAFSEPERHYEILPGGRSKLAEGGGARAAAIVIKDIL